MDTYVLFGNGMVGRLVMSFYGTDQQDLPLVEPIIVGQWNKEVKNSALLAVHATYHYLGTINHPRTKYCVGFQILNPAVDGRVYGDSMGLCFFLKFLQEVYHRDTGKKFPYTYAATGEIFEASSNAQINAVGDIIPKLNAAIEQLEQSSKVFFPTANLEEIKETRLFAKADERRINLIPVSNVSEAGQRFFSFFSHFCSLNLRLDGDRLLKLITPQTPLPIVISRTLITPVDNCKRITLELYQGDENRFSQSRLKSGALTRVSKLSITTLPPHKRGELEILVCLKVGYGKKACTTIQVYHKKKLIKKEEEKVLLL